MAECGDQDDTNVRFCDPCQLDKEHTIALGYCEECKEYLCKVCRQAHRKVTATRGHFVKEVENQSESISCESGETCLHEKCLLHTDQLLDHYCTLHEEVCCVNCLSTAHRSCQVSGAVKSITDYVKTIDMTKELEDIKNEMNMMNADLNFTMHLVKTSLKAVELNHDMARSEMLKLKSSAIEKIEEVYNRLDKELNNLMTTDLTKTLLYKKKCDAVRLDLDAVDSYLKGKIKDNKQLVFSANRNLKLKMNLNRTVLEKIRRKKVLSIKRYEFEASSYMENLINLSSFGTFDFKERANKTVRLVKNLNVHEDDEEDDCCITGIAVLSKGTIVVADKNNKSVKIIDEEEERIVSKVSLDSAPWDVTAMSDNQFAVTMPDIGTVNILSLSENRTLHNLIERKINVGRECCGIEFAKDRLHVIVREPPMIVVYNMKGELVSSVELNMSCPEYITTNPTKSKIFVSDNNDSCYVKVFDIDELKEIETLGSCKDEVTGMSVDLTGVLYYCNTYDHDIDTVCVLEGHGCERENKTLISETKSKTNCVAFNDETYRLFLGMDGNKIAVYYVV